MLSFEDDWTNNYRVNSLPKQPQKTDPLGQHKQESSYNRAYHLQNFHDKGYETSSIHTNDPFANEKYYKKQHFVRGLIPGGSENNKMIYGTDELLRQSEEKKLGQAGTKPVGFMYGSDAATNVGKQKPTTRPNNALWLEQRVFDDRTSQNKKLAFDQDDFLERHKREKQKQMLELQNEKKQDLEMLRSFEPWGKPGAGAPIKGTGPNKWEARRTKAVSTLKEEEYNPLGGRGEGGGAPNRTVSGKPLTLFRGDPELRFPNHSQSGDVVPSLRYKKDKHYGKDLENFMDEVKARKQLQREESFQQELRHISQDPFGKPGAGAAMKNEKGELKSSYPTTLSQDIYELRTMEPRHPHAYNTGNNTQHETATPRDMWPTQRYDPWGKGYGGYVERTRGGKIVKAAKPKYDETEGIGIPIGRPGAGAPNKDNDGNIKTKKAQTLTKDNYGKAMSRDFSPKGSRDLYDPFGRPGAGAPIRQSDGKVKTRLIAKVQHDGMESPTTNKNELLAKQTYLKTLQDMKDQAEWQRKTESEDLKKSGGDVASWLRSGVVGQPQFDPVTKEIIATHKHTSDVTQQKLNIRRMKNDTSTKYHQDLQMLAEERQQQRNKEREMEKETSLAHVNTMNCLWGRPGGGAPLDEGDAINARKQRVGLAPADEMRFRLM